MADEPGNNVVRKNATLMISYSRKDKVFVKQLYDGLLAKGFAAEDIWVDWEGIPLSADWMAEITKGIQSANVFIFVISPDSVASEVCAKELEIAASSNKRFIPILHREPGKEAKLHPKISSHNWVFIRDEPELEKTLPALIGAINTDLDWLAQHTRFQNRALEWANKGRNDSYLVRGNDLQEAETFIGLGAAGKEPAPTPLHVEYVQAARKYAADVRRRNRIITAVVGVILVALTIFALIQRGEAYKNLNTANTQEAVAQAKATEANEQRATAQANEVIAQKNAREAGALALAAEAINQKDKDSQLSLMLALLSIQATDQDKMVLPESKSALFASLNSPNVLYTFPSTGNIVWSVAYDPNGIYVAIGDTNGIVQIWDAPNRQLIHQIELEGSINGMDFSPDGKRLGIARDVTASVWDVESGEELFALAGHDGYAVNDIDFSPDGKLIATGGGDWYVKLWNAESGSVRVTLPGHEDGVNSIDFSPDGKQLVSGSDDDTAILWDVANNVFLRKFRPDGFQTDGNYVKSVAFSPDGTRILTGGYQTVVVWDAIAGTEIHRLRGNQTNVYGVAFSPDGLSMLTASSGVKIWDYNVGTERYNLSAHRGEVTSVEYGSNGQYILTGSWDTTAKLWSADLLIETLKMKDNNGRSLDANYSSDGKWIVTVDGSGFIFVHDAKTGEVVGNPWFDDGVNVASFDPQDSQKIVSGDDNGQVKVWVIGNDSPTLEISAHANPVNSAAFSLDGRKIITASDDGTATVWDAASGNSLLVLDGHDKTPIYDAQFNDAGSLIVTASQDKTAQIWDAASGKSLSILKGHTDYVLTAVFSHDGRYVYTGSYDNTVRKWDVKTGKPLQTFAGHTGRVKDLDISPDDTLLVSGSADTTVKVWDLANEKVLYNYQGNYEDTNSVAFSPDGKRVLTASDDNTSKEFTVDYASLLLIAQEYELRPLTKEECQRFLKQDDCSLTLFGQTASNTVTPSTDVQATPVAVEQPTQVVATETPVPSFTDTPVPAAQSSGAQSSYTEDFNGNLDGWINFMTTGIDSQVAAGIDSGSLVVQLSPYEDKIPRYYLINDAAIYSRVQVEMVTTNHGNNANGVSLICGYSQSGWYEFDISNAGLYSIFAYDPSATSLQGYVQLASGGSAAIKAGQATNTYIAICNGNELTLSVNGTVVKTITDTKYNFTSGKIGIGVSSPQTLPVDVSIDSLTVSEP